MAADGSVVIEILGDADDITAKLKGVASGAVNGLKTAFVAVTAAVTAASAAVGALAKQSLDAYGNYEQLVGGVETLFGAGGKSIEEYAESAGKTVAEIQGEFDSLMSAQETVLNNAANAYKTAGLSANEYMETVTGFSAALIQSLGGDTEKAAQVADMAITDMADNANKMGTAIESIQNAYQGFAKQNYTMLDNLKLGYGGTKEEMQRLLADAEKLSGIEYDISSYADIVDAIHVVQTEMGITGTTAKEAATTIQGSLSAAGAAWQNLITGIADENADLSGLIDNLVESAATAADNIVPRVIQILSGMGEVVQQLAPILSEQLPALISGVLPDLVSAGSQLLAGLITGLISALPSLVEQVPVIVKSVKTAFSANAPTILSAGKQLLDMVINGIITGLPSLAQSALGIIQQLITSFTEALPEIVSTGAEILTTLALAIADSLPELVPVAVEAILTLVDTLTDPGTLSNLLDAAIAIILALADGLIASLPRLVESAITIVLRLQSALIENAPELLLAAVELIAKLAEGLVDEFITLSFQVGGWVYDNIVVPIAEKAAAFAEAGKQLIQGLWNGINDMAGWIAEKIRGFGDGVLSSLKSFFGIASPSKLMRDEVGRYIGEGIAEGITDSTPDAVDSAESMAEAVADTLENNVADSVERGMGFNGSKAGEAFMDAVAESVENGADTVRKATGDVADVILKSMDGLNARLEKQQQEASDRAAAKDLEDQERKIQEKYDKLATATEKEKTKLYSEIEKLESDWNDKQLKAQEAADQKLIQSQIKSLETIQKEYEKAYGDIEKSRDKLAGRLQDYGDLFTVEKINGKEIFSVSDLQSQIDDMNAFADAFTALRDKGADKGLLDEILAMNTGDATKFAEALLKKTDADFEDYLAKWEEKQNLAAQIATGIYEEDFEALNTEFLDKVPEAVGRLPGEMEPVGEQTIQALADGMAAKGEEAVAIAEGIADDIEAELTRITDLSNELKSAVEMESARLSAQLTVNSNAPAEAQAARSRANAYQNAVANAAVGGNSGDLIVTVPVNGTELARATITDYRKVGKENPETLDDT